MVRFMGTHRYEKTNRNLPGKNSECIFCGLRKNDTLGSVTFSYNAIPLSFIEPPCIDLFATEQDRFQRDFDIKIDNRLK